MGRVTFVAVLALLILQCSAEFKPIQRTWKYAAVVNANNVASGDNTISAVTGIKSRVVTQIFGDHVVLKFKDVQASLYNGNVKDLLNDEIYPSKDIPAESAAIMKPVIINYLDISNITILHEADDPVWSVNMKRAFISAFIVDLESKEDTVQRQHTLYGSCKVTYNHKQKPEETYVIVQTIDYTTCKDSPSYESSTTAWDPTSGSHTPVTMDITYTYTYNGKPEWKNLKKVFTTNNMQYQSMPGVRSIQRIEQAKNYVLLSETDTFEKFDTSNINVHGNLTFDYSKGFEGGREDGKVKIQGAQLIESFNENFGQFKEYFNTVPLKNYDTNVNDSIYGMFESLHTMNKDTLQKLSTDIFAKNDNLYQHMFLSYLPYLGTEESLKFIKALIENEDDNLNDLLAIKILSTFPVYLDDHSEELLVEMEPLMNLKVSNNQVKYAGILSFASLVADVNSNNKIDKQTFKKYVNQYYKNFKEADEYEIKMTYLLGLINFNGDFTDDMIEICADTSLSHHLRALAIYGFKKFLNTGVPDAYKHFWSMVKNQTEHYEVRVAAMDLLLYSDLSSEQFQNIINWYHDEFENPDEQHLAHYLYTTLMALENSTGYYEYLGEAATEAIETMKPIKTKRVWSTGNYRMAFTDEDSNFGGSLQARLIANPDTNIVNVGIFSLDSFALSVNLGSYTAYIKTQGLPDIGFIFMFLNSRDNENPVQHLLDLIKKHGYKLKNFEGAHIEVVLFCDDRVVFGMYIDEDNVDHYSDNPLFMDLLLLVLDYNSLSYPLQDYTYLVSDMGTSILVSHEMVQIESYELENIDKIFSAINSIDEIQAIEYNLKYRSIWMYTLSSDCYNPLVETSVETYKFAKDEMLVNIPYSFNLTDFVFKWKHTKDSFNWVQDHVIGSYVDQDYLDIYCDKCESVIYLPIGEMTQREMNLQKLESVIGVRFNVSVSEKTIEQKNLDDTEPKKEAALKEIIKNHNINTFSVPFAKPVLLVWHAGLYNTFIDNDIYSISVRTEPYYNEPTETVFDLEIDANDIKNDRDPISGEEFDFSVAFTNRISHNAEVLNYFNASVIYKTKSEAPDTETQPHIEHSYDIKLYYDGGKQDKFKVCIDREVLYPNRRVDKYSLDPVDPTKATTKVQFGRVEKISDNCPISNSFSLTEIYTSTEKHKQHLETLEEHDKCKKQSKGFKFIPPTTDCLASHKFISKYDACAMYADFTKITGVPDEVVAASQGEFGMKILDYKRVNETHVSVALSEDLVEKVLGKLVETESFKEETKVPTRDQGGLMSLSPSTVAYDDQDLQFGLSSVCYITPDELHTFHDKVINNYNTEFGPDAVAFVECLNDTQSGLTIQRFGDNSIGFKLWSENNTIVASVHEGKAKVVYNGEERSETNVKDDDFKIYFLDQNVIYLTNGLLDIQYTTEYISVKILSIYNNYICGLCSGDKQ